MFQTVVEKTKTLVLCPVTFFRKIEPFMWQNRLDPRQDTDNNIIRRIRYACWVPKTTDTQYILHIAFTQNNGCTNAPQC